MPKASQEPPSGAFLLASRAVLSRKAELPSCFFFSLYFFRQKWPSALCEAIIALPSLPASHYRFPFFGTAEPHEL